MSSTRPRRPHSTTAWLAVVLQFWLGLAASSGLVFCLAADGHVAVERAHPGEACSSDLNRHHREDGSPIALRPVSGHDHPCLDLPAVRAEARDGAADGHLVLRASRGAESVVDRIRGEHGARSLAWVEMVHAPAAMRHLRVTVLLV